MAVSLLQTGVSGLLSAQQQLTTTGHNISNANTDGYSTQRAEQNATIGQRSGGNYLGTGTYIQDITRIYDEFSFKEQSLTQSSLGKADSLNQYLSQLDQVMSTSGGGVIGSLEAFYQATNGVADNPSDEGLRSILLNHADVLTNSLNKLTDNFDSMTKGINGEIEGVVNKISQIAQQIASINADIMQSLGATGSGKANDLLDQRNRLVTELSEYTNVNALQDSNGIMTVMIGEGTTLVAGITALSLTVNAGDPEINKTEISLVSGGHTLAIKTDTLGGSLGARIEFRDEHLDPARKEIDLLAMAISSTLNDSQASGLDLNATQGVNIFTDINTEQLRLGRVLTPASNIGTTQAEVIINDVSLLTADEFEIRFDGTDFTLYNLTSGSSENLGAPGAGTPAGTHTPSSPDYGFSFVETGTPVAGDVFTLIPTNNSAALMQTTILDGTAIAASTAVAVTASSHNISDGRITISNVTDPVNARTSDITVDVYESAPGIFSYRVYDTTTPPPAATISSGTYASGESVLVDIPSGFQIEITGDLVGSGVNARETFLIGDAFGVGNGHNALIMAKTQENGVINGGTETFNQSISSTTSIIGSNASDAHSTADTAQALYTQAYNRNQEISGVNLDEEAANLLQYQQAYQASSQIITTANTIFDTILSALR